MDDYQRLLDGDITLADLSDTQLKELRNGWVDEKGLLHPLGRIWGAAQDEIRKREQDRATKPKKVYKEFYS